MGELPLEPVEVIAASEAGIAAHLDVAELRGRVSAFRAGRPMSGVVVRVSDERGELLALAQTDSEGLFVVRVPAGRCEVLVLGEGAPPMRSMERLGKGERVSVAYRLRVRDGEALVVYGNGAREEVSRLVWSGEELRRTPGSFGDPVRALQGLPGVARASGLEGSVVVRGAEGANTGFYVDGMAVPYLFHTLVGRSVMNPSFVDEVAFMPGGAPSRYGEVTQAVVDVRTNQKPVTGRQAQIDVNLLDAGASVEVMQGDWTGRASGRYSWIGGAVGAWTGAQALSRGEDSESATYVYPRYWDFYAAAEHAGALRLSAALIASRDGLLLRLPEGTTESLSGASGGDVADLPFDPDRLIDAGFVRLRLRAEGGDNRHRHDTWVAAGPELQQNLIGRELLSPEGPFDGRVRGFGVEAQREDRWSMGGSSELLTGGRISSEWVEAEDFTHAYSGQVPVTKDTRLAGALFGEWLWRPGPWLVAPGLRASVYRFNVRASDTPTWWLPEPRLTVRRAVGAQWHLKGAVGRYSQMPAVDRYAQGVGNPTLPLSQAWQASGGAEWSRGVWSVDSAVYAGWMQHLVQRELALTLVSDGEQVRSEVRPEFRDVQGRAQGIELMVRNQPSGGWFGWVSLGLGRAERLDGDERYPADHDQPFSLTLLSAWQGGAGWGLSGRFRLTSGHPHTPLSGAYDPVQDVYIAYAGDVNSARYPWFHQLDIRAERTWNRRVADWTLYVDVFNAYWARNAFAADYNYDFSELEPTLHLPILPTLGVEARF